MNLPGATGATGADGEDGQSGINSFSLIIDGFTVPAVDDDVSLSVSDSSWMLAQQIVFIQNAGYYQVVSKANSNEVTVTNLGYDGNAAPAAVIGALQYMSPGGLKGLDGSSSDVLDDITPTNTKGQILVDNGANSPDGSLVALTVGTNGQALVADSTQATGLKYVTLTTLLIAEATNLYFTNARAIASTLTGFASGSGNVLATDTILAAFGRLEGRTALNDAKVTGSDRVLKAGDTMTGALVYTKLTATQTTLTYAATTDIDMSSNDERILALTGNVTFTTSNKVAGRSAKIYVTADASIRTLTFPAWRFLGVAAPANIAANKTAILSISCTDTTDAQIRAAWAVEP